MMRLHSNMEFKDIEVSKFQDSAIYEGWRWSCSMWSMGHAMLVIVREQRVIPKTREKVSLQMQCATYARPDGWNCRNEYSRVFIHIVMWKTWLLEAFEILNNKDVIGVNKGIHGMNMDYSSGWRWPQLLEKTMHGGLLY